MPEDCLTEVKGEDKTLSLVSTGSSWHPQENSPRGGICFEVHWHHKGLWNATCQQGQSAITAEDIVVARTY